ncbi:YceI family protein [Amycolatopsis sp. CA-161197]|uniref:YceI family protein n=1 Tax=Amycolatopsis sp. CA-161197 TaxID=3239922 RepID=UPI003D8A31FD
MSFRDGQYRSGPQSAELLVKTRRTGLGSRVGHDLTIEASEWVAAVSVNTADPALSSVLVDVVAGSLRVRSGSGGIKPLTDSDRAEIEKNIRTKILHTDRYHAITFHSTRVIQDGESLTVDGNLTIMDQSHPITVLATVSDDRRIRGGATIVQTQWGIKPYSAFFGALKLANEVAIEFDAELTAL